MTTENTALSTQTKETAIVVSSETQELVKTGMPNATEQVQRETMELIEAIKRRAQVETQNATEFTRDAYLNAVHQAKEAVENTQLFVPERITQSWELLQKDAEKNWDSIVKEITAVGDRLTEAAKAAWDVLTAPRDKG